MEPPLYDIKNWEQEVSGISDKYEQALSNYDEVSDQIAKINS